eukprot:3750757-Rhodomonas_salina.2
MCVRVLAQAADGHPPVGHQALPRHSEQLARPGEAQDEQGVSGDACYDGLPGRGSAAAVASALRASRTGTFFVTPGHAPPLPNRTQQTTRLVQRLLQQRKSRALCNFYGDILYSICTALGSSLSISSSLLSNIPPHASSMHRLTSRVGCDQSKFAETLVQVLSFYPAGSPRHF